MTVNIDNYEDTADLFTFPYNPRVVDRDSTPFRDVKTFPYAFTFIGLSQQLKATQSIVLQGHTSSTNKNTDFSAIKRHFEEAKLKKLFFASDRFWIGLGMGAKDVDSGGRTNFVDYVARFMSPVGILFGSTQHSVLFDDATDANDGDIYTPIEYITGSVTSGQTVTIRDANDNGFSFVASGNGTFTYKFITLQDLGNNNKAAIFSSGWIGSVQQKLKIYDSTKSMVLGLEPGDTMNDITITETNITGTYDFRDGWAK